MSDKYEPNPNGVIEGIKIIVCSIILIILVVWLFGMFVAVSTPNYVTEEDLLMPRPTQTR